MLADRELATIRAALAFWRDEMSPHGVAAMRPYLDDPSEALLDVQAIETLRRRFLPDSVRYARFVDARRLVLVPRLEAASSQGAGARLVTLLGDPD